MGVGICRKGGRNERNGRRGRFGLAQKGLKKELITNKYKILHDIRNNLNFLGKTVLGAQGGLSLFRSNRKER